MKKGYGKAFYIFLCSIMGMVLFVIFHRAIIVIYYILLDYNFGSYAMGLSMSDVQMIDFFTGAIAMFIGGWYGVWLGLHWYGLVYEGEHEAGLLHGFLPHHWRKHARMARKAEKATMQMPEFPKTIHVPVTQHASGFEQFKSIKPTAREKMPWDFDDLDETEKKAPAKRKRTVAAKAAKPRKTVARKAPVKRSRVKVEEVV